MDNLTLPLMPALLTVLGCHNPEPVQRRFITDEGDLFRMYRLATSRPDTPEDRQLLALLVNHHAEVHWDGQERHFGSGWGDEVVDRYGVGSTRPRLWVLGERANPGAASFPLPFGTAAGRAMLWPHLNPWEVRLSNTLQPIDLGNGPVTAFESRHDARRRLAREWRALGEPLVLLVGAVATAVYTGSNILGYLEHPQYIWRFHHALAPEWSHQFVEFQQRAVEGGR